MNSEQKMQEIINFIKSERSAPLFPNKDKNSLSWLPSLKREMYIDDFMLFTAVRGRPYGGSRSEFTSPQIWSYLLRYKWLIDSTTKSYADDSDPCTRAALNEYAYLWDALLDCPLNRTMSRLRWLMESKVRAWVLQSKIKKDNITELEYKPTDSHTFIYNHFEYLKHTEYDFEIAQLWDKVRSSIGQDPRFEFG